MAGLLFFEKRNALSFDLNESREGTFWRERGRSFHVEGPKTKMVRKPTVESVVPRLALSNYSFSHS